MVSINGRPISAGRIEMGEVEGIARFRFHVAGREFRLHHPAFPRMAGVMWIRPSGDWPPEWQSPLTGPLHFAQPIGAQPFGMPALIVIQTESETYVLGALSEDKARLHWEWTELDDGLQLDVVLTPWGVAEPDRFGSWSAPAFWLGRYAGAREIEPTLFEGLWNAVSAEMGPSAFQRSPDETLTWATWNDGVFRDIDEARILAVSDYLKREIPQVDWIQVDDGWAGPAATMPNEDGSLGMSDFATFYRPERLEGDPRFPSGLKGLADAIRARGFRPMLWLTPSVDYRSELYRDHPDWFLDETRLHFVPEMRFLDLSVPTARDYVEGVFDLVFTEWGYEGTKLDFWSMGFEQDDVRQRDGSQTALEWQAWFLDAIRKRLPPDGRVLHCIDLPFGTPFRSRWFDHFRFYADSEGSCAVPAMMREQAHWTAVLVAGYGLQQFWIPNGDGFGTFGHIGMTAPCHRRWAALMVASGQLTELAGWLDRADPEAVERVRLSCQWVRMGLPVTLPGYSLSKDSPNPPAVWSRADGVVGITNWNDEEPLQVQVEGVGRRTSLFDGRTYDLPAAVEVPPGDGILLVPNPL